jgi:hypothetical protein
LRLSTCWGCQMMIYMSFSLSSPQKETVLSLTSSRHNLRKCQAAPTSREQTNGCPTRPQEPKGPRVRKKDNPQACAEAAFAENASTTDSEPKSSTDPPYSARENRFSISMAYAENSKARNALIDRRLNHEEKKENIRHVCWIQEQKAIQREQEAMRHRELLMALVQQGKAPKKLKIFFM